MSILPALRLAIHVYFVELGAIAVKNLYNGNKIPLILHGRLKITKIITFFGEVIDIRIEIITIFRYFLYFLANYALEIILAELEFQYRWVERRKYHKPLKYVEDNGKECWYIINFSDPCFKFADDLHFLHDHLTKQTLDRAVELYFLNNFSLDIRFKKYSLIFLIIPRPILHRYNPRVVVASIGINLRISLILLTNNCRTFLFGRPFNYVIRMAYRLLPKIFHINFHAVPQKSLSV